MGKIFNPYSDMGPNDEYFWHATSIIGLLKMIQYNAGGIKAIGQGQMGAGFYMAGARSDYAKGMGVRSAPDDTPCFALRIHVKNFYTFVPNLTDMWDPQVKSDFGACFFGDGGLGAVGREEKGVKIPGINAPVNPVYGQLKLATPLSVQQVSNIRGEKGKLKPRFMEAIWQLAQTRQVPKEEEWAVSGFPKAIYPTLRRMGSRNYFKQCLLELALYSDPILAGTSVQGMKLFSRTAGPIPRVFDFENKTYDLRPTVHQTKLDGHWSGEQSFKNFHEEKWVDMPKALYILGLR